MAGYLGTAKRQDWRTPEGVLYFVKAALGGIDLDPCASLNKRFWFAHKNLTEREDGLSQMWIGRVFVNPPYGKGIDRWFDKAWNSVEVTPQTEVIVLAPAAVSANYWQNAVKRAGLVCFLRGRVKFVGAESTAPMPVALHYFGHRAQDIARVLRTIGMCWLKPS
jgi:predicted RNA methylase